MSNRPEGTHLVRRTVAAGLDYFLILASWSAFLKFQPWATPDAKGNYGTEGCALTLPWIAIWVAYFAWAESRFGCTLGKGLLDLKVERLDGGRPAFEQCLKRHLLDPIELFFWGIPALIAVSLTASHQRLGDLWGGTRVVYRPEVVPEGSNEPIV
jgi:uncharacterized RDD family membrane protein YckC